MEDYRTVRGTAVGEYEEKKSRFIAQVSFADSEEKALAFLEEVRAANRTAWALADEHNWNRTQRMGGIVFVAEGAILIAVGLFSALLGQIGSLALIVGGVLGGTLWIYAYSYLVYRGKMK